MENSNQDPRGGPRRPQGSPGLPRVPDVPVRIQGRADFNSICNKWKDALQRPAGQSHTSTYVNTPIILGSRSSQGYENHMAREL